MDRVAGLDALLLREQLHSSMRDGNGALIGDGTGRQPSYNTAIAADFDLSWEVRTIMLIGRNARPKRFHLSWQPG